MRTIFLSYSILARLAAILACVVGLPACAADPTDAASEDLTSASGKEVKVSWQSFVYAAPTDSDATIRTLVQRQVKSAIGALRKPEVGLQDRDAQSNLDPAKWTREPLDVIDPTTKQKVGTTVRVRYPYVDVGLVKKKWTATTLQVPLLFGDWAQKAAALKPACSDDQKTDPGSLWFHFTPSQAACVARIAAETTALNAAGKGLDPARQVSTADLARDFVTVRATIQPAKVPPVKFPESDRLWGFGTDRTLLVVYAFFGVDADERDPNDVSLIEHMRFWRTLKTRWPGLQVTKTEPHALLLDFDVGGVPTTATYDDVFRWVLDGTGFPGKAATDAGVKAALLQQVIDKFAERWIWWELPVRVTLGTQQRTMTLQVRSFWGHEDGKPEWRQAARNRYLEAMWHGDVFLYQGHSHFGHGPLEPTGYAAANWPNRYQVMLVNSCVSFNYYDVDFLQMHPGGSKNLDVVVNGLPAFWTKLGEASANLVIGLADGTGKSWSQVLQGMVVKPSWAPMGYDPLRAVNGELDNVFDPAKTKLGVTVLR